jgi:hypothetical protein
MESDGHRGLRVRNDGWVLSFGDDTGAGVPVWLERGGATPPDGRTLRVRWVGGKPRSGRGQTKEAKNAPLQVRVGGGAC